MNGAWVVFRKELVDALRDRRTLLTVLLSAAAVGPLMLVLLSWLVSDLEARADAREVWAVGIEHAPTLRNFVERQTWTLRDPGPDYERDLRERRLGDAVLVVPPNFEDELARGRAPVVEVVTDGGEPLTEAGAARLLRLLAAFNQEQATLRLAVRGVSPAVLEAVRAEERDVADAASRGAQVAAMVPLFVLLAVLYGALNAALDTTAGERERGSLEPLLVNPVPLGALVLGKWAATAAVGIGVAVLSAFSFLPGQWLLRSESLAALLRYGPAEALWFVALLLPLAGAAAAVLMAVAIRSRSVKEAQAGATLVVFVVSMLPMATLFGTHGEQRWHLWLPGLAQSALMTRVLRGEVPGAGEVLVTWVVCAGVAALALAAVARALRGGALR